MGRSIYSYNFVAVEFSVQELRNWLSANRSKYDDSKYGSTDADIMKLADEWASIYDTKKNSPGPFASIDYDNSTVYGIFFGIKLNKTWMNAYSDVSEIMMISDKITSKKIKEMNHLFPNKNVKIINLMIGI